MLLGWLKTQKKRCFSVMLVASFSTLATQDSGQMPDMALLEYLAELVEVDGELIGPMDMQNQQTKDSPLDEQIDNEESTKPNKPEPSVEPELKGEKQ